MLGTIEKSLNALDWTLCNQKQFATSFFSTPQKMPTWT